MPAEARQCANCGRLVRPRGGAAARFCPTCGRPLAGAPPADRGAPAIAGSALTALMLGILSFIPMFGLILGIAAIASGVHARRRIERSGGSLSGGGLAATGIVLGALGAALWALFCAGTM